VLCGDRWLPILAAVTLATMACCQQARAQGFPAIGQRTLLAEAGSTGGSVGRTDKSISGGEQRSSRPDTGPGRRVNRESRKEETFPKSIELNEHWHGFNYTVSLRNVGGRNYQGTWSHGYVTKFAVTALTTNSMKLQRTDAPAFGACTGRYTGSRTGNRAEGEASISNGAVSKWDASW
jgi:hypothetical protein